MRVYLIALSAVALLAAPQIPAATTQPTTQALAERWATIFKPGFDTTDVWADSGSASVLYANTGLGIFRSRDEGFSWEPFISSKGYDDKIVFAQSASQPRIMIVGNSEGRLERSDDGGLTWRDMAAGLAFSRIYQVVIDPTDPLVNYVSCTVNRQGASLLKTLNGGRSWAEITPRMTGEHYLAIDAVNPKKLFVVGLRAASPMKSTDGGITWAPTESPRIRDGEGEDLECVWWKKLVAIPNETGGIIGLCGFHGVPAASIVVSHDEGETWQDISIQKEVGESTLKVSPDTLAVLTPAVIFAGSTAQPMAEDWDGGLYATTNGGRDWKQILRPAVKSVLSRESSLYAATDRGILRSIDQGTSWQSSGLGLPGAQVEAKINPETDDIYIPESGGYWISKNGGASWLWQAVPEAKEMLQFIPLNASSIYINTGFILVLEGGGVRELRSPTPFQRVATSRSVPRTIYGVSGDDVFVSEDGGFTWRSESLSEQLDSTSPKPSIEVISSLAVSATPQNAFAVAEVYEGRSKSSHLLATSDSGLTWKDLTKGIRAASGGVSSKPDEFRITAIGVHPRDSSRICIATNGNVPCSKDGGKTWYRISAPSRVNGLAWYKGPPEALYIATELGVWRKEQNGADWEPVPRGLLGIAVDGVEIGNKIILARNPNGLYRLSDREISWAKPLWKPSPQK